MFARIGETPVFDCAIEFVHGPSSSALQNNERARHEARACQRELGFDPLSDVELEKASATHWRLSRRGSGLGCLTNIPIFTALVIVPATFNTVGNVGWIVVDVLAVPAVIGLVWALRIQAQVKQATEPYRKAYTRVAAAAFGKDVPGD